MTELISSIETFDVRFPTSRERDGSDAMNPFPDYSAAYIVLRTSSGAEGYGLVFTVGHIRDVLSRNTQPRLLRDVLRDGPLLLLRDRVALKLHEIEQVSKLSVEA